MKRSNPDSTVTPKYPGIPAADDGSAAVVAMETAASDAAGAYPITPSTQMGEGWAAAVAAGKRNVHNKKLLFFEPEGEHAAAAVTAGMSMVGLRATNFSSGQGIAYMHESLYAAVGKRLTYVLNVACRAMTKHALNVHAGHDDYHAIDDTGFFQLFAKDVQEVADLNLISHRIAELSLTPGVCAQDGFLTSHVIESLRLPERELVEEYLGDPAEMIDSPTPAQRMVFGDKRRLIPEMFDFDYPAMMGVVQNQDSYAQGVAAQRPFYFDHIADIADQAFDEYAALTGRRYARAAGYLLDDADYVLIGQGSVVSNAEAVCDHLRRERGIKVGVLNFTMFRPFPTDLVSELLKGKKAATCLERVDQPLAVDPPLLREIRAAMSKAMENGRTEGAHTHAGVAALKATHIPNFYSGCFGLGSRDLQPGDVIASVDNMLPNGAGQKQFYLGIDFIRKRTRLPKLQIWQETLLESYPHLADLALESAGDFDLMPDGSTQIRIHSVGGWGAITMGKNLALTTAKLLDLYIKANPKYGSEKKGQPTTFYASLAPEPIRINAELKHVDVVLSPDPNVFHHTNPLAGMSENGVFIIQNDLPEKEFWDSLPQTGQREILAKKINVFHVDAFKIAADEASDVELKYRMQGAAFMGAFFHAAPIVERGGLTGDDIFSGIRKQLQKKFGHLGERVVEDNVRVIRRGYDELRRLDVTGLVADGEEAGAPPHMPARLEGKAAGGVGNAGRFWEQVGHMYASGDDGIADPFIAISAMPAATSSIRDMTMVRFEVPEFIPANCTGCSQCWTQCPDSAIPGVVNTVEEVLTTALKTVENGQPLDRVRQIVPHLSKESRRIMKNSPFTNFGDVLATAYDGVTRKLNLDPDKKTALDKQFIPVATAIGEFPLAKTAPFFDRAEATEKGAGGLLSITINPETCKGCNICVDVCPDEALVTVKQDDDLVDKLRRNWTFWKGLPETDDRYVNVASIDEGIGVLPSLLLKQSNYQSMVGGDGACLGCGEKTVVHLVTSAVHALMLPRVKAYVQRLDDLISQLDEKARKLLASDTDIAALDLETADVDVSLEGDKRAEIKHIASLIAELKDLRWRYTEGPSGHGRAHVGFANSTGCSSVWASTYPYNPYPFPWVNHLFQDAPSIAIGIFEGHMRKMGDGFISVRKAEAELAGNVDPEELELLFSRFDWHDFTDEEFHMCPPVFAVGGDGAMMDIGFQNLSRLMASGKPIRVMVLDTQVYSNTGGQACTSGYTGQVSDMAQFGKGQHGKEEVRKELALIAMAHRGVYVLQASQASATHLMEGVLKGLQSKHPSVFILHSPCPPEHGISDLGATRAAKLALESRAFPLLVHDPDEGGTLADALSLAGNPAIDDEWPEYELNYLDDEGKEQSMTLPLTIADWAATEGRFKKHFRAADHAAADDADWIVFGDYLQLSQKNREQYLPFIFAIDGDKKLTRIAVSREIVELADERQQFWLQLKEMAGLAVPEGARGVVEGDLEAQFAEEVKAIRAEYEAKITSLKANYPPLIAKRLAEGLLRAGNGSQTITELLDTVDASDFEPASFDPGALLEGMAPPTVPSVQTAPSAASEVQAAPAAIVEEKIDNDDDDSLTMEPYIESARCTTCDECTNINKRLFAYNDAKQAYIKDAKGGTFRELVTAAERCPVAIIHPGAPLNPKEKNLDKWVKRAEPFN